MKAGIITITTGENYGNRLQNYAVQELLKKNGIVAETIHKTKYAFDAEMPSYIRKLKLKRFLRYHLTKEEARRLNFYRFTKRYIDRSKYVIRENAPQGLNEAYDVFVAGSDQVWNPYLEYCTEENFLTFADSQKKVSLAASMAVSEIPEEKKEDFRKWISDFWLLSVREEQSIRLIEELCERKPQLLADPTFALSAGEWRQIEKPVNVKEKKYILLYFLGTYTDEYRTFVEGVAEKNGLDVLELQKEETFELAPDEFLYLIRNAALVCTDSFHGSVFSLIFHTDFVVFSRVEKFASMRSRLQTLLSVFGMENREWPKVEPDGIFSTDFSQVDEVIRKEQGKLKEFVLQIKEGKTKGE